MEEQQATSHPISQLIEKLALGVVLLFVFVSPLAFSPLTAANVYDFPKWLLTIAVAIVLTVLAAVYMVAERKVTIPARIYTIPLSLLFVAIIVSILFSASNKIAFFYGKAGLMLALIFITLSALVVLKDKVKYVFSALLASSVVASLVQVLAFLDVLSKISSSPLFSPKTFTPLGSQTVLASFLAVIVPMTLVYAFKAKDFSQKILTFVIAGVQTIALVFAIAQILPGQPASPKFLPFASGWSIAVDQLKSGKTAFFGLGPDSFASAFTQFRPVTLNGAQDWFVRFGSSSNEWLTLFTTLGLVGLVAFALIALGFVKSAIAAKKESSIATAVALGFGITLLLLTFIPANYATLFLFFVLGIIVATYVQEPVTVTDHPKLSIGVAIPFIVFPLVLVFFIGRATLAEVAFGQSLQYASENKGAETYNSQIQAISMNPYISTYRIAYSNTNLALANSLASKKDLTDDDRQKITQLVSQSIREAKAVIALDPSNSNGWVNLAQIYRQLINFAQGADQWAVSSYVQAIRLDSTNPQLRLDLGGLLYSLNSYEEAIDQFKQAISLKPDYANAYYNLSYAYRQLKQYPQAYAAMQNVVNLMDATSADHEKAVQELNDLQALLPKEAQQATAAAAQRESQLKAPEPTPSPKPAGEVKFNPEDQKELQPPVEESGFGDAKNDEKKPEASASPEPSTSPAPSTSPVPSASPAPQQ